MVTDIGTPRIDTTRKLRGNFDQCTVDMNGLKEMFEMRGGMNKINSYT